MDMRSGSVGTDVDFAKTKSIFRVEPKKKKMISSLPREWERKENNVEKKATSPKRITYFHQSQTLTEASTLRRRRKHGYAQKQKLGGNRWDCIGVERGNVGEIMKYTYDYIIKSNAVNKRKWKPGELGVEKARGCFMMAHRHIRYSSRIPLHS